MRDRIAFLPRSDKIWRLLVEIPTAAATCNELLVLLVVVGVVHLTKDGVETKLVASVQQITTSHNGRIQLHMIIIMVCGNESFV